MAGIRWLNHNWRGRKQYVSSIMKCVRFGLMPAWQIIDIRRNPENPEFLQVAQNPKVEKMMDDGLA